MVRSQPPIRRRYRSLLHLRRCAHCKALWYLQLEIPLLRLFSESLPHEPKVLVLSSCFPINRPIDRCYDASSSPARYRASCVAAGRTPSLCPSAVQAPHRASAVRLRSKSTPASYNMRCEVHCRPQPPPFSNLGYCSTTRTFSPIFFNLGVFIKE